MSAEDVERARLAWLADAPRALRGLLDAVPVADVKPAKTKPDRPRRNRGA